MNVTSRPQKDTPLHQAFFVTVIINGLIALADLTVGFVFLFSQHIVLYTQNYHSLFAPTVTSVAVHIAAQNQQIGTVYFFSHGIIKLLLVWGLLTNRLWAYPLSIVFLSGFGIYQIFTLVGHFSAFTLLLLIVNAVTVFFIAREYRSL